MMKDEFTNFSDKEIPWPDKEDQLFIPADDWWHNACLNYMREDWGAYILGYKKGGDELVNYVKETRNSQDILVYPIVFLYRQYIELRLKEIIHSGKELLDEEPTYPKKHQLDILWDVVRSMLPKIEPSTQKIDLEAIDDAIGQFCSIDPTSMAFRYPETRDGGMALPEDIRYINLRNLADIMDKLASYFDSASFMIDVYIEHKHDMEEYYDMMYGDEY